MRCVAALHQQTKPLNHKPKHDAAGKHPAPGRCSFCFRKTTNERTQGKVQAMDRKFDLALLKVDVPPGHTLPVAKIGRSVGLRAGEFVVAMGSPQGLSKSCTLGIVSATARRRSELGEHGGGGGGGGGGVYYCWRFFARPPARARGCAGILTYEYSLRRGRKWRRPLVFSARLLRSRRSVPRLLGGMPRCGGASVRASWRLALEGFAAA